MEGNGKVKQNEHQKVNKLSNQMQGTKVKKNICTGKHNAKTSVYI